MNGMTEEELLNACKSIRDEGKFRDWTVEFYGHGKWLRKYAYYPSFLPIFAHINHGVDNVDFVHDEEFNYRMRLNFFHGKKKVEIFNSKAKEKEQDKVAYPIMSLFAFARRYLDIKPLDDAAGTLAFPAHSTDVEKTMLSHESYIEELRQLPQEMQPFSVCLHQHDINDGVYKVYLDNGIPVYTAGAVDELEFTENFYNILKKFKYSTSNTLGSYAFYSTDFGIPFSLYGQKVIYNNLGSSSNPLGIIDVEEIIPWYKVIKPYFDGLFMEITSEQVELTERALCTKDGEGISRTEAGKLLYGAYFKRRFGKLLKLFGIK